MFVRLKTIIGHKLLIYCINCTVIWAIWGNGERSVGRGWTTVFHSLLSEFEAVIYGRPNSRIAWRTVINVCPPWKPLTVILKTTLYQARRNPVTFPNGHCTDCTMHSGILFHSLLINSCENINCMHIPCRKEQANQREGN